MSINALPLLISKDTIPLYFKSGTAGIYTFKIDSSALFLNEVNVLLKDNQTNIIHPIKNAEYTFNSIAQQQSNRFSLIIEKIQNSITAKQEETAQIKVYYNNKNLVVSSTKNIPYSKIKLFNTMGQLQFLSNPIELSNNPQEISTNSLPSGLYVVSIFSETNIITSKWIRIP